MAAFRRPILIDLLTNYMLEDKKYDKLSFMQPRQHRHLHCYQSHMPEDKGYEELWAGGGKTRPLIPVEMLSEIFLLVSQFPGDKRWNWRVLMLVCRHWRVVMLSTPGLDFQLRIRRGTQKGAIKSFIQGRKTRLRVTVDMNDEGDGSDFDAENFHACFTAAIQAASRWSSLNLISLPPHGEYKHLQILQPLTHLESTKCKLACDFDELFEPLIAALSRNALPDLTAMVLADPAAVLYLGQPACSHIYHSLTTLKIQLLKRMDSPVDILPHFQRLETLEASRLCLPFYSPGSTLPLTNTLRFLYLKAVSVQWLAGHVFPALEKCRIILPHHTDTIHASQPVTMPSCFFFLYNSNDLHPLSQFHLPSLETLDVKNAQWNVWRGNPQFVSLYPILATTPQCLTRLRLDVQCSERLLVFMLRLAPVLEELWLGLAHPNALSKTFCQAFSAGELQANGVSEMVGQPSQMIAPLCPSLKLLHLHYRRWIRGPDQKALVVAFGDIVGSRQLEIKSPFSLRLSFGEASEESHWTIGKPVRKIHTFGGRDLILGISTPYSITPISTSLPKSGLVSLPVKNPDSLHLFADLFTSYELLLTRDNVDLMVYESTRPKLPSSLPGALPLFYALRVLVMKCDNPLILAGHTLHKLERCRLLKESWPAHRPSERMLTETGMPVCTRVDIDDPLVLAAFQLPQIHELALDFSYRNCSVLWEKHIAVNANLSGLNLLHMKNLPSDGDLIPILRSLPSLETLIINAAVDVDSLTAFLPMDVNGTPGLKQTSSDRKIRAVLCPRLRCLKIETRGLVSINEKSDLVAFAKDIITLRAKYGSPLKDFTIYNYWSTRQLELIGRDGGFAMEDSVLAGMVAYFKLDI